MGSRNITVWTCNRCGIEKDMENHGQPEGWVRLYTASPPNHADHDGQGDYCPNCKRAILRFMGEAPPQVAKAS